MSELLKRQFQHAQRIATLLRFIFANGKNCKMGRALCCEECSKETSLHRLSLANDILVFDLEGNYLTKTEDYLVFGEFWEKLGGTWGGRWGDGNHFSSGPWEGHR